MLNIVSEVFRFVKEKMCKLFWECRNARIRVRYLIVFNLWNGDSARLMETKLDVS